MACIRCGSQFVSVTSVKNKSQEKICLKCGQEYEEFETDPMIEYTKYPKVGQGTKIWEPHLSNIHHSVEIGQDCKIHSHVWIGEGVKIGNNVKIQAFSFIPKGVTIEDNAFIGPRVTFTNDKYPPSGGSCWTPTLVKRGAVIGAGAVILPGITIHENARVGAGSVVTKDVPANTTVCGNPAKPHNKRDLNSIRAGDKE